MLLWKTCILLKCFAHLRASCWLSTHTLSLSKLYHLFLFLSHPLLKLMLSWNLFTFRGHKGLVFLESIFFQLNGLFELWNFFLEPFYLVRLTIDDFFIVFRPLQAWCVGPYLLSIQATTQIWIAFNAFHECFVNLFKHSYLDILF